LRWLNKNLLNVLLENRFLVNAFMLPSNQKNTQLFRWKILLRPTFYKILESVFIFPSKTLNFSILFQKNFPTAKSYFIKFDKKIVWVGIRT
jgi:hypothetical protein